MRDSVETDTQTDMLLGEPKSAICVQRFDDSLNSAIHTTYRTWLRSSSMHEPRDPPLKVVSFSFDSQNPVSEERTLYSLSRKRIVRKKISGLVGVEKKPTSGAGRIFSTRAI